MQVVVSRPLTGDSSDRGRTDTDEEGLRFDFETDEKLYFVIDEKNNTIDLTERGIDLISGKCAIWRLS